MINRKFKILPSFIPDNVIIDTKQGIGKPSHVIVKIGDMVKEGDTVAKPVDLFSNYAHTPIPGVITNISQYKNDHYLIGIKYKGAIESLNKEPEMISNLSISEIINRIESSGIVENNSNSIPLYYLIRLSILNNIKEVVIDATRKNVRPFLNSYLLSMKKKELKLGIDTINKILELNRVLLILNLKDMVFSRLKSNIKIKKIYQLTSNDTQITSLRNKKNIFDYKYSSINNLSKNRLVVSLETIYNIYESVLLKKTLTEKIITIHDRKNIYNIKVKIGMIIKDLLIDLKIDINDRLIFYSNGYDYIKINDINKPITKDISNLILLNK